MSVTAKQLSQTGARGGDIDAVIRDQLAIIDSKLSRHDRVWGRNVVSHDLPEALDIPGLDKKNAQRIVYSAVLSSLEKRGFETGLLLETDRTTVYAAWMTDLDVAEAEAMNALIRARRLGPQEVATFVKHGLVAAPRAASAADAGRAKPAPRLNAPTSGQEMQPRGGLLLPVPPAEADGSVPLSAALPGLTSAEAAILYGKQ